MNTRAIQDWLILQVSELLQIDPATIDIRESFTNYGLSSRDAVTLSGELEELLGRRLSPTLAYEYPSILALARHLAENDPAPEYIPDQTAPSGRANEPVAIIGMSCRFPGANDPEAFWQLLVNGVDAISEVPADRWPKQAFFHPDPATPGKTISQWGGFLDHVDQFDPFFFGISPNEAKHIDPQQRLLLELAWEALDHACQSKEQLDGSRTGVFVGISVNEYSHVQFDDPLAITSHSGTGSALSIAANRISYFFNFRGPSMAIDTACSSSLAAVHLACQSLRNGECPLALAGGVNIVLSPAHSIAFTKAGVLAPDGRCKTFDARANGYVRGEGGGLVVLKPLSAALADGDPVLAVICGSAMAQDGRTNGLMAPNRESQEVLLREAYQAAAVSPAGVQYVEAHGTGTLLGDSMEAAAIGAVIGAAHTGAPCLIGSVKTNIGHLEAAAGVAGLIKVVLSLQHRTLPPSLHYQSPNPHIPFEALHLRVQHELTPWPSPAAPAMAGVSSFGFGGTNVHVVVREAPQDQQNAGAGQPPATDAEWYVLPLSANSPENLLSLARGFQDLLATHFDVATKDICYAAGKRRGQDHFRLAAIGRSRAELSNSLQAFAAGEPSPHLLPGDATPDRPPRLVFVFSGQGGQWQGMGRELLKQEAVFAQTIEQIERLIRTHFNWSLKKVLLEEDTEQLDDIDVVQPAIFAIQVALAAQWKHWGITPDAVIGHSMGEVAAAYVAGALSLEDAVRIICPRSRRLKDLRGKGKMLATDLSPAEAETWLKGYENEVSLAALNGPTSTVLSGEPGSLQTILEALEKQNRFCRWVKVDVASHSPQIEQLRPDLLRELAGLRPLPAQIPLYSTVTGALAGGLVFDAGYWVDNIRKPVLFSTAIEQVLEDGYSVLIEIGPHPLLLGPIQQCAQSRHREITLLPSMRREEPEHEILLRTLGALYSRGYSIAWENLYPGRKKQVPLPRAPWRRQRYWMDTIFNHPKNTWRQAQANSHPLLGDRIELAHAPSTRVWQTELSTEVLRYLEDHRIEDHVVLPAAAYMEMAWHAAEETGLSRSHELADFVFLQTLPLEKGKSRPVQAWLVPGEEGRFAFEIYSRSGPEAKWIQHASVSLLPRRATGATGSITPAVFQQQPASTLTPGALYESLQWRGMQYGPAFRGIEHLWRKDREALGQVSLPESLEYDSGRYQIHPALLDACLQVVAAISIATMGQDLYLPSGCRRIRFYARPAGTVWSHATLPSEPVPGADSLEADIRLFDAGNQIVAELTGFRLQRIGRRRRGQRSGQDISLYRLHWQAQDLPDAPATAEKRKWLIFADQEGLGIALAKQLEEKGDTCHLLPARDLTGKDAHPTAESIAQILKETGSTLHGIVHLWSLSIPPQSQDTSQAAMDLLGCNSVLHLVQALASRFTGSPRLWLVTRGAQSVHGDEPVAVEQSALWGLGKVISFELPELKCVRIDLDPRQSPTGSASLLSRQMSVDDHEDQVAFRAGERFVLRLLPFRPTAPSCITAMTFRADATYLITGGWGGLGLATAKWMAQQGARHLILLGRSEPSSAAMQVIEQLRAAGAEVRIVRADVSDPAQLKTAFEPTGPHMPALKGVIHAAGLLDDGSLLNLDTGRMKNVMAPKVEGAWNLHQATAALDLDFFVLFSSAVSVLGSPGQGNYAAASAYLDAMAHYRRQLGLPAISINWGPWAEVGLAAEATEKLQGQNASTQHLVKVIDIDQGLETLELLLEEPTPQVAVLPFDLKHLLDLYPTAAAMPFFAAVGGSDSHVARLYARPNLRQPFVAPRNELERKLAGLWQQTLHIDRVGVHDSFFELGGDSVLAAQILALARKTWGIGINPQDAFKAFTIERLAELLEAEILKQIEDMSEEEAQRRLT